MKGKTFSKCVNVLNRPDVLFDPSFRARHHHRAELVPRVLPPVQELPPPTPPSLAHSIENIDRKLEVMRERRLEGTPARDRPASLTNHISRSPDLNKSIQTLKNLKTLKKLKRKTGKLSIKKEEQRVGERKQKTESSKPLGRQPQRAIQRQQRKETSEKVRVAIS